MKNKELTHIVEVVQKDINQFEMLYSYIIKKVYFWCFTIMKSESEADDATQEAMILIYKKLHTLKEPEYFSSWMYRVVTNCCYSRLNKKKDLELTGEDDFYDNYESRFSEERKDFLPKESLDVNETKKIVAELVNSLPNKQRETITLYYLEEFKVNEIAKILGCNSSTIKVRMHEGRRNLKKKLDDYQQKHNIKLYSSTTMLSLGIILKESYENMHYESELAFDSSSVNSSATEIGTASAGTTTSTVNATFLGNIFHLITGHLVIAVISVICISAIIVVVASAYLNQTNSERENINLDIVSKLDMDMVKKLKGHPYIEDIVYPNFPTRSSVIVSITLKKDINENDITILSDGEMQQFQKEGKDVYVEVTQNGLYEILIDETEVSFLISNLNENAPELVAIKTYKNYLQLIVNDENYEIDYEKSYVEYEEKNYEIPDDLKIMESFKGSVKVVLFHNDGSFIVYSIEV